MALGQLAGQLGTGAANFATATLGALNNNKGKVAAAVTLTAVAVAAYMNSEVLTNLGTQVLKSDAFKAVADTTANRLFDLNAFIPAEAKSMFNFWS